MITIKTKKILVTGAAGFIGSHFCDLAQTAGYRVIALDALTYSGCRDNLKKLEDKGDLFVKGNICNQDLVLKLLRDKSITGIINFAAESHVDRGIVSPTEFITTNIVGTYHLLEASLNYWKTLLPPDKDSFRFLQVSTDEVFGSMESGSFNETSPINPSSPYSASKASADLLVGAWYKSYGLPTIKTFSSNNYGPRQFPEKLIPLITLMALAENPLPVYGDGSNVREWLYVLDHCRAILRILEDGIVGESYCVGGELEISNLHLIKQICEILDEKHPKTEGSYVDLIEFVSDRPGHDWRYSMDSSKIKSELQFEYHHRDFSKELASTIEWYLENLDWCQKAQDRSDLPIQFDWGKISKK